MRWFPRFIEITHILNVFLNLTAKTISKYMECKHICLVYNCDVCFGLVALSYINTNMNGDLGFFKTKQKFEFSMPFSSKRSLKK